jgi:23S rRNA pseudouridine2457 synthase
VLLVLDRAACKLGADVSRVVLLNKPFGVLTQFSKDGDRATLSEYVSIPSVYPAGRLDADSEGLVLLTDDGKLQAKISHPRHKLPKRYWVQVEGVPEARAITKLKGGLDLGDFHTAPCECKLIPEPSSLWPRNPPIRFRAAIPTSWLEVTIREGKNRQVRRMTAKIGHPCLRLIRYAIGHWTIDGLLPGEARSEEVDL